VKNKTAITLKDLSEKVGKSITTVSRALSGYADVSPETIELVQRVAKEMGYTSNAQARRLQKQSSETIGLILPTFGPRFSDPFLSEFIAGIGNMTRQYGYDILVSLQPPGEDELDAYRHMAESNLVDGFIVVRTRLQDERINYLQSIGFPFVCFGRDESAQEYMYVDEDGVLAMSLIVDHLVRLGHRKIACITSGSEYYFTKMRLDGFLKQMSSHHLEVPDEYIRKGALMESVGFTEMSGLLALEEPPTAVIAFTDLLALGAIGAVESKGLIVGKDVSISGFDDIPLAANTMPPLTTIHQPTYAIGSMVSEMLIKAIEEKEMSDKQVLLEPELLVRQSTGFVKESQTLGNETVKANEFLDVLKAQLADFEIEDLESGFRVQHFASERETVRIEMPLKKAIFPNREGEYIADAMTLPENFDYSLSYPGNASSKSMVLFLDEDKGIFIGGKPTPEFSQISVRRIRGNVTEVRFDSREHNFVVLPFEGNWKKVVPTWREVFGIAVQDPIDLSDIKYMLQIGIRKPNKNCYIEHFDELLEPVRYFYEKIGGGHIMHFYGANQAGFDRMYPRLRIDPILGDEDGLRAVLDEIHEMDMLTSHHFNPRLADYNWVLQNRKLRDAIVRNDEGHFVIEDYGGHPFYLMDPNHPLWFEQCMDAITRMHSYGFDYVQLDQFTQQHNFYREEKPMHAGYLKMVEEVNRLGIGYWLEGMSDLHPPTGMAFSQILVRKGYQFWKNGEPAKGYLFGESFPEFFTTLMPNYRLSYRIMAHGRETDDIQRNLITAKKIHATIYDLQLDYFDQDYMRLLKMVVGRLLAAKG
jgi:LacI family transcriptional regulator